jgi:2-polyprenyl-3-methyl-5-hydroxy-6-metoxy-1,4-benzoquinol methylase
MVNPLEESKAYWDNHPIGAEIFDVHPGSLEFYEQYLRYYDEFYDYKEGTFQYEKYADKDVLDIGCGLGIDTIKFARAGARVTAIDLSETSVNCTRKLFECYGLNGDIRLGDAQRSEFSDNSFDVVYAYGVLMHVEDETLAINEIYRVLRPGGQALVVLYHRWSWFWALVKLSGTNVESQEGDPPLNRVYSRREARQMFSQFSSLEVSCDRLPVKTRRRKGLLASCYNYGFVPLFQLIPAGLARKFGWHLIVKAVK